MNLRYFLNGTQTKCPEGQNIQKLNFIRPNIQRNQRAVKTKHPWDKTSRGTKNAQIEKRSRVIFSIDILKNLYKKLNR
jgi:hypothetical protein